MYKGTGAQVKSSSKPCTLYSGKVLVVVIGQGGGRGGVQLASKPLALACCGSSRYGISC